MNKIPDHYSRISRKYTGGVSRIKPLEMNIERETVRLSRNEIRKAKVHL